MSWVSGLLIFNRPLPALKAFTLPEIKMLYGLHLNWLYCSFKMAVVFLFNGPSGQWLPCTDFKVWKEKWGWGDWDDSILSRLLALRTSLAPHMYPPPSNTHTHWSCQEWSLMWQKEEKIKCKTDPGSSWISPTLQQLHSSPPTPKEPSSSCCSYRSWLVPRPWK